MADKVRIKDIAEKSGVSVGTVDRVLHNRPNVSKTAPPKSWSKARREEVIRRGMCPTCRPDLDNLMKGVADALNGVAYKDDGQIAGAVIRKQYGRKDNTRVIIETMDKQEG